MSCLFLSLFFTCMLNNFCCIFFSYHAWIINVGQSIFSFLFLLSTTHSLLHAMNGKNFHFTTTHVCVCMFLFLCFATLLPCHKSASYYNSYIHSHLRHFKSSLSFSFYALCAFLVEEKKFFMISKWRSGVDCNLIIGFAHWTNFTKVISFGNKTNFLPRNSICVLLQLIPI